MDENLTWLPYLNFALALIAMLGSIGAGLFYAGKWTGTKDYIHKEIVRLENQVTGLFTTIEGMRKETKDDRHMFRGDLQRWQEGLLRDINHRFDGAKVDGEKATQLLREELNRRFDTLDCITKEKK